MNYNEIMGESHVNFSMDYAEKLILKLNLAEFEKEGDFVKYAENIYDYLLENGSNDEDFLESIKYMIDNEHLDLNDYLSLYEVPENFEIDLTLWKENFLAFPNTLDKDSKKTIKLKKDFREFIKMFDVEKTFDLDKFHYFLEDAEIFGLLQDEPEYPYDDYYYEMIEHGFYGDIIRFSTEVRNDVNAVIDQDIKKVN